MVWKKKSTCVQEKPANFSELPPKLSTIGIGMGKTNVSEQEVDNVEFSKKTPTEIFHFEDLNFSSYIKKIESRYWFTNGERKRPFEVLYYCYALKFYQSV